MSLETVDKAVLPFLTASHFCLSVLFLKYTLLQYIIELKIG